ncbi:HAD-IIA family hydrolase [Eubacteriales bacterium OttesenSCG-928-N13]|nr:HAD-IIA family hydrolase [Eubacteriales bacterium OttesenSCG-928-N13]
MATLHDVRCFLLDMDGTFYLGDNLIEGSLEFIRAVQDSGRDFLFLTNNSSHSAAHYVKKLARMGLNVPPEKVLTSGQATALKCRALHPRKRAFVLGNRFLFDELTEGGIPIDQETPEYVIIGYDTTLDYAKMTAVCDFVRAGLPYVATHPDFNCPTETGFAPDIGAIIAFIEASTGRRPDLIVGKPHQGIVDAALDRTGFQPDQLAMVGDRLYTDVATGLAHGMLSILVLSGETTPEMAKESDIKPHLTYDRLSDMIGAL